jgi:hypothetical protein
MMILGDGVLDVTVLETEGYRTEVSEGMQIRHELYDPVSSVAARRGLLTWRRREAQ